MRFPMFVDISNKNILVVGAGKVGCRRIETLLMFNANIQAVSRDIYNKNLVNQIDFINRDFKERDIENQFMVIAATDNREVNHRIYEICIEKNIPVSSVDCPQESTFYFPAICMNDKLCVGLVSDGEHHTLVKETAEKIRGEI